MNTKKIIRKIPGFNKLAVPYHQTQAFRAATKYDYPAASMKVIAVTGTNGKTTTCFMIHKMLSQAGKKVGLMTTVAYGVGNDLQPQDAHMTTVSAGLLNKRIAAMREAGAEYLVLEVTSHALAQHRAFGIPIDVAVMTNVTHEHLDYHKTFKDYVRAKRMLFKSANKTHGGQKTGIINADDASANLFADDIKNPLTYGIENGDLQARQIKLTPSGIDYYVKIGKQKLHIKSSIPGEFNVYNSLAAVAVGLAYELTAEQIENGIAALKSVAGRMNRIDAGQDFDVIIDFGHTPDAFEKVFRDMRPIVKGKMIAVFGSPGRRDVSKRATQGELAGKYCDVVIVTEDDPRDTPVREISEMIASGARKAGKVDGKDLFLIDDRKAAIAKSFSIAKKGDAVLLMSKGHEKTIYRATGDEPWNEAETARKLLKQLREN